MPYTAVPRGGALPTSPPTPVAQRLDSSDTDSVHDDLRRGYGGVVPPPPSSHARTAAAAVPPAFTPSERLARSVHQGAVHHRAAPKRASGPQQRAAARAATVSSLLGRAATTTSPPSTAAESSSCGDGDDDDEGTFSCESASPATVPLSHRSSVCSSSSGSGSFCAGSRSDAAAASFAARDQSVASSTSSWTQPVPPRFAARHSQQQTRANIAAEPVTEPLRPFQLRTILLSTDDEQPPKEARQTILSGHNFLSFMSGGSSDGGADQPTPTPAAAAAATAAAAAAAQQQRVTVSVSPVPAEEVEDDPVPVPPPTPPSPALLSSSASVSAAANAAALSVTLPSTCFAERSGIVFRSPSDAPVSACAHAQQATAADAAPLLQAQAPTAPEAACVAGTVPPSVVPMAALKAAAAGETAVAVDEEDDDAWWRCSISPPSRSGSGYPTSSVATDAAAASASADAAEVSVLTAMTTTTTTTVVAAATAAATVESTHSDALPLLGQRGRRVVDAARAASVSAASSSSSSSSALSIEGPRSGAAGDPAALPLPAAAAAQSEESEVEGEAASAASAALAECLIAQYEGVEVDVVVEESEEGGGGDVAQTTRVSVVTASVATEHATVATTRSLTTYSPSKGVVASSRATARVEALTAGGDAGEERSSLSPGRFAAASETPQRGLLAKEDELWGLSLLEESPAAEMPEKLSVQLYSDTPSPVRDVSAESAQDEVARDHDGTDAESSATLEQRSCLSGRPSSPLDESVYSESPLSLEAIVNLGQRVESIVAEKNGEISVLHAKIASLEAALALERGGGGGGGGGGTSDAGSFRSCVLTQTDIDVDACCGSPVTCPAPLAFAAAAAPPSAAAAPASASASAPSTAPSPSPPPPQVQRCDKQVQASGGDDITLATMLDTAQIQAALDRASGLSRCFPPPVEQLSAADLKALDTKCASLTSMVVHVEALVQQNATLAIRCLDSIIHQGSHAPHAMGSAGAALVATAAAGDSAGVAAFGEVGGAARAPSPELLVAAHTNAQFAILTNRLLSVTVQQQRRIAQLLLLMGMGQHEGGRRMKG